MAQTMQAPVSVGARIRQLRVAAGLQVQEAAERAKVAPETWSRVENGHFNPRGDTLGKMASVFGMTPAAIYAGEDVSPQDPFEETALTLIRRVGHDRRESIIQFLAGMAAGVR